VCVGCVGGVWVCGVVQVCRGVVRVAIGASYLIGGISSLSALAVMSKLKSSIFGNTMTFTVLLC